MKRLCLILAYLFLFTQTASAMPLLVGQKVVYRGTITGLRISAVDGTAFIDNAGATIPTYADGNHQIEIYDSSNRMLKGVLKAAGTGETVGSELITSWTNLVSSPYETFTLNANGHDIDSAINDVGGIGWAHSNSLGSAGILSKLEYARTLASGTAPSLSMSGSPGGAAVDMVSKNAADSQTIYTTLTGARYLNIYVINVASNFSATNSFKQVLTPSSSGCTIVSAKGGTTYKFSYKNAPFTYNASSYYVIIRAIR